MVSYADDNLEEKIPQDTQNKPKQSFVLNSQIIVNITVLRTSKDDINILNTHLEKCDKINDGLITIFGANGTFKVIAV